METSGESGRVKLGNIKLKLQTEENFPTTKLLKGLEVVQDLSRGVLTSGSSLVLQEVRREQAGNYACFASNLEGDTSSDSINIQIRCE